MREMRVGNKTKWNRVRKHGSHGVGLDSKTSFWSQKTLAVMDSLRILKATFININFLRIDIIPTTTDPCNIDKLRLLYYSSPSYFSCFFPVLIF